MSTYFVIQRNVIQALWLYPGFNYLESVKAQGTELGDKVQQERSLFGLFIEYIQGQFDENKTAVFWGLLRGMRGFCDDYVESTGGAQILVESLKHSQIQPAKQILCASEDLPFKRVRTFSCLNFLSVAGTALRATNASDS